MTGDSGYDKDPLGFYMEPPWAVQKIIDAELKGRNVRIIHDFACGRGTIPKVAIENNYEASGSDYVDRANGQYLKGCYTTLSKKIKVDCVLSNPPFMVAQSYINHTLEAAPLVIVLLRLAFLESNARKNWWPQVPLYKVWVHSERVSMPPGNLNIKAENGKMAYAWFVFDKNMKTTCPTLGWL